MIRTLVSSAAICAAVCLAGAAQAASSRTGFEAGPFTMAAPAAERDAQGVILVIDSPAQCAEAEAAAQAMLAEQQGKATGVISAGAGVCNAAARVFADNAGDGPEVAFASRADALGPAADPADWLATRRARGVYVWDLAAYRRLNFTGPRQILGIFDEAPALADMTEAALDALSRNPAGYFLLIESGSLDSAARAALERAARSGARVVAADGSDPLSGRRAELAP